jgi:hypothetical protein
MWTASFMARRPNFLFGKKSPEVLPWRCLRLVYQGGAASMHLPLIPNHFFSRKNTLYWGQCISYHHFSRTSFFGQHVILGVSFPTVWGGNWKRNVKLTVGLWQLKEQRQTDCWCSRSLREQCRTDRFVQLCWTLYPHHASIQGRVYLI